MLNKTSIYYLTDSTEIPKYVGATTQKLKNRLGTHLSVSKKLKSLKDKWIFNNRKEIKIILIEECELSEAKDKEKLYIKLYNETIFNKKGGGDGLIIGWNHSEETKKKISETQKENQTPEYKKLQSDAHKGIKMSEKNKDKLKNRMLGNEFYLTKHSEETKKKISEAQKKIRQIKPMVISDETRKKISDTLKGNIPVNKGKPMSDEQRQKLKDAWIGRKLKYGNSGKKKIIKNT